MADLPTVRAEIKAWERSFKDTNGSGPTLDDIRANAAMAEKYKLYKRLSKAAALSSSTTNSAPLGPTTPPRRGSTHQKSSASALASTSRVVQPTAPLAAFNPFSPQKKSRKDDKRRASPDVREETPPPKSAKRRSPSQDSLHNFTWSKKSKETGPSATPLSYSLPLHATPESAVTRARKRLRGEPVSPSPNKDKRRKVTSQSNHLFTRLNPDIQSEDEPDIPQDEDDFFVDNSPMKAKTGKLFPALFEHDSAPVDLFGIKSDLQGALGKSKNSEKTLGKQFVPLVRLKPAQRMTSKSTNSSSTGPSRGNSKPSGSRLLPMLPTPSQTSIDKGDQSEISSTRSSAKRALTEDTDDESVPNPRAKSPLLPPSPPPEGDRPMTSRAGKSKASSKGNPKGRKKSRLSADLQDEDESDEQEFKAKLKIVNRRDARFHYSSQRQVEEGAASDSDPNLDHTRFALPHAASPDNSQLKDGDIEIDLPDQLRSVLAIDSAPIKQGSEETLVKGLLYGRRATNYDPIKGGEIWDVGEDDNDPDDSNDKYAEGEDDWEGEPVPWELAEL